MSAETTLRPQPDTAGRQRLLEYAQRAGWPRLRVGRLTIYEGEARWRQRLTLATSAELALIAAALALATGGASRITARGDAR
jgi:hypothetical protein